MIKNKDFAIASDFKIDIINTPLKSGESIRIQYGTKENKLKLTRKQQNFKPECLYRINSSSKNQEVNITPMSITALEQVSLNLRLPSVIRPSEEFSIVHLLIRV